MDKMGINNNFTIAKQNSNIDLFFAVTAFLLGAALPTSAFLLNAALGLSLICMLLNRDFTQVKNFLKNPLVFIPILIFFAYLLSSLIMQNDYGLNLTGKYRKLLYPVILIPFFLYDKRQIFNFFKGFQAANIIIAIINIIAFIFISITGEPFPLPTDFFKKYLTQSFFLAISAFIWLIEANKQINIKTRYIYLSFFLLSCFNVLFILPARIGLLALIVMIFTYIILNARVKHLIIASIFITISLFFMVATENVIISRTIQGIDQINLYVQSLEQPLPNAVNLDRTSMGLRIGFAHKSIELIKNAPILGNGAGSFLYKVSGRNPHNEYLFMAVQFGFIGLLIFIYWLYNYFILALKQESIWRSIFCIIITSYIVGFFFNSFLLDLSEGTFFMISNSALVSLALQDKKEL